MYKRTKNYFALFLLFQSLMPSSGFCVLWPWQDRTLLALQQEIMQFRHQVAQIQTKITEINDILNIYNDNPILGITNQQKQDKLNTRWTTIVEGYRALVLIADDLKIGIQSETQNELERTGHFHSPRQNRVDTLIHLNSEASDMIITLEIQMINVLKKVIPTSKIEYKKNTTLFKSLYFHRIQHKPITECGICNNDVECTLRRSCSHEYCSRCTAQWNEECPECRQVKFPFFPFKKEETELVVAGKNKRKGPWILPDENPEDPSLEANPVTSVIIPTTDTIFSRAVMRVEESGDLTNSYDHEDYHTGLSLTQIDGDESLTQQKENYYSDIEID